jgi:hypothetical protein
MSKAVSGKIRKLTSSITESLSDEASIPERELLAFLRRVLHKNGAKDSCAWLLEPFDFQGSGCAVAYER